MARTSHMDESKVVIQMKDIVKKFGDFTANDHINLTVSYRITCNNGNQRTLINP